MAEELSGAVKPSSIENSEHVNVEGVRAKRVIASGYDGSALQDLTVDADGHLQIDVLSGGGGGTLRTNAAAVNAADTAILVLGTDGSNYRELKTDSDGNQQVDVLTISSGDNNIGNVDIASAIPAGTNIIGAVKRDVVNYTVVRKAITFTGAQTDGILWSPAAGKKWVVTDMILTFSAAITVLIEEDKAGGDEAVMYADFAANGGVSSNLQSPIIGTEDDADLLITTSAGNVKGILIGYEID